MNQAASIRCNFPASINTAHIIAFPWEAGSHCWRSALMNDAVMLRAATGLLFAWFAATVW